MELLENKADFFGAESRQPGFVEPRHVRAIHNRLAGRRRIESAKNIDERRFARA